MSSVSSVSLPLLEGLQNRPGEAEKVVQEALTRWEAARRIARWLSYSLQRHKAASSYMKNSTNNNKRRRLAHKKQSPPPQEQALLRRSAISTTTSPCWEHWIFQSLRSPLLSVRQATLRILVKGCTITSRRNSLAHALVKIIDTHVVQGDLDGSSSQSSIQLVGLLSHLVCEDYPWRDVVLGETDLHLKAFCSSGGLQWITRSIVSLCQKLSPHVLASSQEDELQSNTLIFHPASTQDAIQVQLLLLVNLCFRLVLYATVPSPKVIPKTNAELPPAGSHESSATPTGSSSARKKRARTLSETSDKSQQDDKKYKQLAASRLNTLERLLNYYWNASSSSSSTSSPLANLICAYEMLKDTTTSPTSKHILYMLQKLVDPHATVSVIPYEEQNGRKHNTINSNSSSKPNSTFTTTAAAAAAAAMDASVMVARAMSNAIHHHHHVAHDEEDEDEDVVMEQGVDDDDDEEEEQDENQVVEEQQDGGEGANAEIENAAAVADVEESDDVLNNNDDETVEFDDDEDDFVEEVDGEEDDDDDDDDEDMDSDEEDEEDVNDLVVQEGDDDDGEGEDAIVDVVRHFERRLMGISDNDLLRTDTEHEGLSLDRARSLTASTNTASVEKDRSRTLIKACMQVLAAQHPPAASAQMKKNQQQQHVVAKRPLLSTSAEQSLIKRICNVVKPPRKPLNLKMFMRRAPTQEEFFRGSLTRNPIPLTALTAATGAAAAVGSANEPTVRDLRQHIANDLQMSESAELIELLVGNQILDLNLKLRVVQQVLWKNYLIDNSNTRQSSSNAFFGSGLSVIFSSTGEVSTGRNIAADTPVSALPPMVVTYRLVGVDGEATEDHVTSLEDPEAPSSSTSPEEQERLMENEYGVTRLVTEGRGISVLLRSIESDISDTLRRIRRDDVVRLSGQVGRSGSNPSRTKFRQSPPCSGLTLLRYCTKLASNRKKLLEAQAPTFLLRLLLDVLNALDEASPTAAAGLSQGDSSSPADEAHAITNPTADVLQELIETLASDMSPEALASSTTGNLNECSHDEEDAEEAASTLPLLLSSLRTIYLGPPLRKVIAKLLPFLTYGQASLSRELASNFVSHVKIDDLGNMETSDKPVTRASVLMDTFVKATMCIPPSEVCGSLRTELKNCGFVDNVVAFVLQDIPHQPPPWSSALWSKGDGVSGPKRDSVEKAWRSYFLRSGLRTAFQMLSGLCNGHEPTQSLIAGVAARKSMKKIDVPFLTACHWLESTSDNSSLTINTNGMGLLAETLLDDLSDRNDRVSKKVKTLRKETRDRKKEIATETRSKTLVSMSSFGPMAGDAAVGQDENSGQPAAAGGVGAVARRVGAASLFFGLFRDQDSASAGEASSSTGRATRSRVSPKKSDESKPSWLAEMEAMEDETGLTCAVCQEGRTLQPSELLGLYAYVKKVALPYNKGGGRANIDGTVLLTSLPSSLPGSLVNTNVDHEWFRAARIAADSLEKSIDAGSSSASSSSQRHQVAQRQIAYLITSVSAGNAIHCSCHSKARSADRNHPRAPKSEWEGASLRNSRIACNAILPLVSSNSKVPLIAVDVALSEHQSVLANILGHRPKSMLWVVLHDVRLLLLRMAYGEALNNDCGGGSLSSNSALLFYQLFMADMFAKDADHDAPDTAQHARYLSSGFLAGINLLRAKDYESGEKKQTLRRAIADAAPMAALCCVLFHNSSDEDNFEPDKAKTPHSRRRWVQQKEDFLRGLIMCAGRRHALSILDSGCATPSRGARSIRSRSSSFNDWDLMEDQRSSGESGVPRRKTASMLGKKRGLPQIDDFAKALRPMITLYAILDQLSADFVVNMDDEAVEACALRLASAIETCQKSKDIHDLLEKAKVTLDHEDIIEELQMGMMSA